VDVAAVHTLDAGLHPSPLRAPQVLTLAQRDQQLPHLRTVAVTVSAPSAARCFDHLAPTPLSLAHLTAMKRLRIVILARVWHGATEKGP
jgi:hypothetical protein